MTEAIGEKRKEGPSSPSKLEKEMSLECFERSRGNRTMKSANREA